jgi:repressor LexA
MSVKNRVKDFAESQNLTISAFEKLIKSSNGYVNSISKSIGLDKLELIIENFPNLDIEWLLTGNGSIIKSEKQQEISAVNESRAEYGIKIPLVTTKAVGGFGNNTFAIADRDVKEYYVIPKFKHKKVDFMIEVEGSSMYPKYNSGDVVACTIISEDSFIQWNKTHVVATRGQGIIIKRIKKGAEEKNLCMISDNKAYDPFEVPKDEITGIALVVGVIRLE